MYTKEKIKRAKDLLKKQFNVEVSDEEIISILDVAQKAKESMVGKKNNKLCDGCDECCNCECEDDEDDEEKVTDEQVLSEHEELKKFLLEMKADKGTRLSFLRLMSKIASSFSLFMKITTMFRPRDPESVDEHTPEEAAMFLIAMEKLGLIKIL